MRESLSILQRRLPGGLVPAYFLKPILTLLLTGLDYLHSECAVIHTGRVHLNVTQKGSRLSLTDLKPDNILLGIEDNAILTELVAEEEASPTPAVERDGRFIYAHRNFGVLKRPPGRPKISDFGLAFESAGPHYHAIQPVHFHAPEVILGAGWSFSADIWNLGVLVCCYTQLSRLG